jgi:DNA polymerase elongation subunit (family B)
MSHYVHVEQVGNRIIHRYVDKKGSHQSEVIREFPIKLYVRGNKTSHSSIGLHGEILNPIEFSAIDGAQNFIKEQQGLQEIYGQTNLLAQFLYHRYTNDIEFDFTKINVLVIDIEVEIDESGFPTPAKANQMIQAITCHILGDKNPYVVFGYKPYTRNDCTYIQCNDEFDLFDKFQLYWREVSPDIVTGWNIDGFDIPYLINRSIKVKGEDFTKRFSPNHSHMTHCLRTQKMGDKGETYKISGVTVMDYLDLYKKYSGARLESYRLEVVAQHELKEGKIDYGEYTGLMDLYDRNFELFIQYNKKDVELVAQFEKKLNYIFLSTTIAYLGKVRFEDIHSQVRFWDNHIYNTLQKKGIQIPPTKTIDQEEIIGAYVKDPVPNLYRWVVTLDLTSLYPSIIMTGNLSPETLVISAIHTIDDIESYISFERDLSFAKKQNVVVIANGATFRRDRLGVFPELVKDMFGQRKACKNHAISISKRIEAEKGSLSTSELQTLRFEEATYDAKQQALKIALNSLYGASANRFFRYNSRDIAEGITLTGQLVIRFISNRLNVFLNETFKTDNVDYVIFNDTDSAGLNLQYFVDKMFKDQTDVRKIIIFLDKFVRTHIDPVLKKEFDRLADYLNAYENMFSMKREILADRGLWRGKKNYILQVWDKEGVLYEKSKLKMMGVEMAKSSTPKIVRGSLEQAIRIILNGTESDLQKYVREYRAAFLAGDVADIAFPRGVSDIDKWVAPNGTLLKGAPIHVRGAVLFNQLIKKHNLDNSTPAIKNGDKIKFAYLQKQNPTRSNVIGFLDHLPPAFGLDSYIDRELQFEKTFLDPLNSFARIVKWNTEKTNTLDQFFI